MSHVVPTISPVSSSIWRLRRVCAETSLSRSYIYLLEARGEFPQRVSLGRRAVGWRAEAVQQWLRDRPEVH